METTDLITHIAKHSHRFGESVYLLKVIGDKEPSEDDIIEQCGIDFTIFGLSLDATRAGSFSGPLRQHLTNIETMTTCYETKISGWPIKLEQRGENGRFRVTYGLQVKEGLRYADAAAELGACIMHALACEGKLGNEGK